MGAVCGHLPVVFFFFFFLEGGWGVTFKTDCFLGFIKILVCLFFVGEWRGECYCKNREYRNFC